MKNRLQFNRIPTLFVSGETMVNGTTVGISGRDKANSALTEYISRRDFIPLIGEPIVVRYIDDKGNKQMILAVGKATGQTTNDTYGIEYHRIDTAKLTEDIDKANENADEALELASGATKDTADYLTILKNMIISGVGLSDGAYFDNNGRWDRDPSQVGLYKPIENANYIEEATSFRDADKKLDEALGVVEDDLADLSGITEDISGTTKGYLERIIAAAGLNDQEHGEYQGHDETHFINNATSLDSADVLLDIAVWDLSANTYNTIFELSAGTIHLSADTVAEINRLSAGTIHLSADTTAAINQLSAGTVSGLLYLSGMSESIIEAAGLESDGSYPHTHDANFIDDATSLNDADVILDTKLAELSANTTSAEQELQSQIDILSERGIVGVSAITIDPIENAKSRIALLINEEDDKVLSQNTLGLKASISLTYTRDDKKIYLKGKNDTIISVIDADDFIKDGMLETANIIVATQADHAEHPELIVGETYLKFVFNTDSGKQDVFVSAKDLVDTYSVAPASHTYMDINNYVITLNVDQENGLASYNYARNVSAVTANIVKSAGLNMGDQGGYPGHDETHYIKSATSLDNADVLLDAAIWATSGLVIDTNNKVDTLSGVVQTFSAHTVEALSALSINVDRKIESGITFISGVVQNYVEEKISGVSFDEIYSYISEVEEVTAGALNDLNERVGFVETHMTGEFIPLTGYEISTGLTEDELTIVEEDTVNEAFGKIQKQILDNEESVAAALNSLNVRIEDNTGVTALSGAVMSFSSATFNQIKNLSAFTQYLSGNSFGVLTVNLNGAEQGKYCPSASTTLNLEAIQEVTGADVLLTGYEISSSHTEEELVVVATDTVNDAFGKIQRQIYDNEIVIAGALNDLNDKIIIMSGDVHDLRTRVERLTGEAITGITVNGIPQVVSGGVAEILISSGGGGAYYTAGNGINISNQNAISVKLANKGDTTYLNLDGDGIYLSGVSKISQDVNELSANTIAMSASVVNNRTDIDTLSASVIDNELVIAAAFNDLNRRVYELSATTINVEGPSGTFVSSNTVTNIAFSTFLSVIKIAGQGSGTPIPLTIANAGLPVLPADGVKEAHVIIENTANAIALVKLSSSDTRLKLTNGDEIYIEPYGIGELNAMITYDGTSYTIYIITT